MHACVWVYALVPEYGKQAVRGQRVESAHPRAVLLRKGACMCVTVLVYERA